ncbi:MAG TPA: hypothetical protein VI913_00290, partial [Candidatus Peribacteraceae bacterium]|nr:hypothetical protein [Candidatus Peribacteraceae bacterium]
MPEQGASDGNYELNDWQRQTVQELVAIPSNTPEGERQIMEYIQERIGEDQSQQRNAQKRNLPLRTDPKSKRRSIHVVELGAPPAQAELSVLLHSHVDIVDPDEQPPLSIFR